MKKFFYYFSLSIIYYFLTSTLIFFFGYFSIINEKIYKNRIINAVQKSIYFEGGYRNIWQSKKECINFDVNLLYVPKVGSCNFKNIEFDIKLTFDEYSRTNQFHQRLQNNQSNAIAILGDSLAMGWGVNDDQTYSAILEKKLGKKVFNQAVSSYGTVRQVKRFKISKIEDQINTIIIHYNLNDLEENQKLNKEKLYESNLLDTIFVTEDIKFKWILRQWKRSFRVIFNEIKISLLGKNAGKIKVDLDLHLKELENIINENLNLHNKRIIILFIEEPHMKLINKLQKPSKKNIEYFFIKLNKDSFFIIDDHLNEYGHQNIASKLAEIL